MWTEHICVILNCIRLKGEVSRCYNWFNPFKPSVP